MLRPISYKLFLVWHCHNGTKIHKKQLFPLSAQAAFLKTEMVCSLLITPISPDAPLRSLDSLSPAVALLCCLTCWKSSRSRFLANHPRLLCAPSHLGSGPKREEQRLLRVTPVDFYLALLPPTHLHKCPHSTQLTAL